MYSTQSSDTEESLIEVPILPVTQEEKSVQVDKQFTREQIRKVELYERAYVVEYNYLESWQIQYALSSWQNVEISEPPENKERFKEMHHLLLPLLTTPPGVINRRNMRSIFSLPSIHQHKNYIGSVLDIVPHRGFLPPHKCQLISIAFFPKPNTIIQANAVSCVLGGVDRKICIQGDASNMGYELDTDYVDFGRQVMR